MDRRVRHPRALTAFRAALYLGTAAAGLALLGLGLAVVLLVAALGSLSLLLTGDVNTLAVLALSAAVLVSVGALGAGLAVAARHVDRRVTLAARVPDPISEARDRYVGGGIDEAELERRIERALDRPRPDGEGEPSMDRARRP